MNILIECGDLNPPFAEGTRNIARMHLIELKRNGHNVSVLTRRFGVIDSKKHKRFELVEGIKYYRWSNPFDLFFLCRKIISKEKIDIIHIFAKGIRSSKYLYFLRNLCGVPVVFTLLGFPCLNYKNDMDFRKFLNNIDLVFVSSKTIFSYLTKYKSNKLSYLPYGVDTSKFKLMNVPHMNFRILCWKPPSKELLDAYKQIQITYPDICFILHKSKNYTSDVMLEYIKNIGLNNVHFVGYGDILHASELLSNVDIVVELHVVKDFLDSASPPLFLLESMLSGKKVIATDIPEIREIISCDLDGVLTDNDCNSLYNSLKKTIVESNKLGLNARAKVIKSFDIQRLIKIYISNYNEIIVAFKRVNSK